MTLTGTKLINGITGNLYTPSVSTPSQVISLAPATSGGMSLSLPNVANTGSSSASGGVTYVISSPGGTSAAQIGPANLIAALPANLQPSSDLFYYNPQEQDLVLQQAALTQTGEASFINCLSCSASGLSVADQDTALLYQNAVTFATANSIQLGTALTQSQIASLTQPILWYVDETVPDPSCTATGGATCPTVTALMPQVYLPPNYNAQTAEGNIEGSNVTLNFDGSGGSVLNTGNITASNTLTVNTPTLTNQQNSTNVGQIWNYIQDTGYEETTGTMAQPGGTMSAGNMVLNVQAVNQIGGALQELNTDGSVDTAATQQLLSTLQAQLGSAFQQSTVTNDLNTSFVKQGGDFSGAEPQALVVAVIASVATMGTAAALMDTTILNLTLPQAIIAAAASGMVSSTVSQAAMMNGVSLGAVLEAGAVSAITAGLTGGITYNSTTGELGFTPLDQGLGSLPQNVSTLGQLAGITSVGSQLAGTVSQATASTAADLPTELAATVADATISAGVQTAIEGGSFLNNLKTDGINDAAADAAYAIGDEFNATSGIMSTASPLYVLAHAALGCAASSASGTGCESGAIGGATSAVLSPSLVQAMDPNGTPLNPAQTAIITALATLSGAVTTGLAGGNAQAGATWAENEALNNATAGDHPANESQSGGLLQSAFDFASGQLASAGRGAVNLANLILFEEGGHQPNSGFENPLDPNDPPTPGGGTVYATGTVPVQTITETPLGPVSVTVPLPVTVPVPSGPLLSSGSGDDNSNGNSGNNSSGSSSTGTGSGNQTAAAPAPSGDAAATPSQTNAGTNGTATNPFATSPGEAVFWSGATNGIGGAEVAGCIASSCGGTTLEQLLASKGITLPPWNASDPDVVAAWQTASAQFAKGASGDVTAVIGSSLRPGNVWQTVELPALQANL